MKTSEYLDLIKEIKGLRSDRQAKDVLKVSDTAIVFYRQNTANFGPETCMKVAELTGIAAEQVAADMMAARAKDRKTREYWLRLGGNTAGIAQLVERRIRNA